MTELEEAIESICGLDDMPLKADGFDEAIIGMSLNNLSLIYDHEKIITILMVRDGMTREEAYEFFDFNILGAYVGDRTPIYSIDLTNP
jgi:hypothetical protein